MSEVQVDELADMLQEMVDELHRAHQLRCTLAAAAIDAHMARGHEGPWLTQPDISYCPDEDCTAYALMVLNADRWLESRRDMLDVPASDDLWHFPDLP